MIPINKPQLDEQERLEVLRVLEDESLTSASMEGGKYVREFEQRLKSFLKVKHVIAVNSGTSALYAALLAKRIGNGDEVILPSFTFVATANAVIATGATPIFADILLDDYTISPAEVEKKITKNTKAIIPVHLYGHPAQMKEISEIALHHSLDVIEDACQSLGSSYFGRQTGTLGDMGCFSLYASKVITSGEGGAVATNDDELGNELRMIRNHGMVKGYDTKVLGLNLRLPEISAAIAKVQMEKLLNILSTRRKNALALHSIFSQSNQAQNIKLPIEPTGSIYNWYLYTVMLHQRRDEIKSILQKNGIGATVYYDPPVHMTPYYSSLSQNTYLKYTELASKTVLSLPVHQSITVEESKFMANRLIDTMEKYGVSME